jgi:hypothetical protein
MAELHTNGIYGNYEGYLAQLFNPAVGGQFNPGMVGPIGSGGIGTGYGGFGAGAVPNAALPQQTLWPQQQVPHHPLQLAVQAAQQIAARQAVHAVQCAQALQQIVQHLAAQQFAQQAMGWQPQPGQGQPQFGQGTGAAFGAGQIGSQVNPQSYGYGWGVQNPALQQQAMPQLAQYLAAQQPGQFRYGWVN